MTASLNMQQKDSLKQYKDHDVKVNVEVVASDQRDELLNVKLNGGTPPDIFFENTFCNGRLCT